VRLAAALSAGERVLDADTPAGAAALWRAWPEVLAARDVATTPRGFHVWQCGRGMEQDRAADPAEVNAAGRMVGGDVKVSGYVVWPGGGARRWIGAGGLERLLRARFPGTEPGRGRIARGARTGGGGGGGAGARGADPAAVAAWLSRQREGSRNNALNWAAWTLRAQVARIGWEGVAAPLRAAALGTGLEEAEVERTLRSALGDPR
jgi:hypothetical protein